MGVSEEGCFSTHTGNEVSSCVAEQPCVHIDLVEAVWDCL